MPFYFRWSCLVTLVLVLVLRIWSCLHHCLVPSNYGTNLDLGGRCDVIRPTHGAVGQQHQTLAVTTSGVTTSGRRRLAQRLLHACRRLRTSGIPRIDDGRKSSGISKAKKQKTILLRARTERIPPPRPLIPQNSYYKTNASVTAPT